MNADYTEIGDTVIMTKSFLNHVFENMAKNITETASKTAVSAYNEEKDKETFLKTPAVAKKLNCHPATVKNYMINGHTTAGILKHSFDGKNYTITEYDLKQFISRM